MRNFKLTIEYDGAGFSGWQVQPDRRTVQGEILSVLAPLSTNGVKLIGAGRTDAGVHAVGQVASAALETRHDAETIHRALCATLPGDILVRSVEEVPPSFHARYDARSRRYHYIFITKRTALWRQYYYEVPEDLDIDAMRGELAALRGRRDFTALSAAMDERRSTICSVTSADLLEAPPLLTLSVVADRFLTSMVRIVAGTVLRAGQGEPVPVADILASGDRSAAGPTLPPHALYLMEVLY
jgi:tRNA pseudouridine38-40 synthase